MTEIHRGIGHIHVKPREKQAAQDIGGKGYQDLDRGTEHHEVRIVLGNRGKEDGKAAGDDHQDGQEKEHADVVRNLPVDGTLVLHTPDTVQGGLDAARQLDDRIEEQKKAEADEDAALRVFQIRVDEVQHHVGELLVDAQVFLDVSLYDGTVS